MQSLKDEEFEILGLKLRYTPESSEEGHESELNARDVVEYVQSEILKVQKKSQRVLDNTQVAILVALNIAAKKLEQEQDFANNLERVEKTANDALAYLNEVSTG